MGKSTISMVILNSYVSLPEGNDGILYQSNNSEYWYYTILLMMVSGISISNE